MPDTAPKDFSTTAVSNGTVGGINIAEGSTAAQLNDAIRAVLAVVKTADWGSTGILADVIAESTAAAGVTIDGLLIKDGALPNLTLGDVLPVGTMRETFKATADTGWKVMDGSTLGSAASAAADASDDNEDLFTFLWDNVSNTYAAVSSGRGANAAADWAANKTITIPNRQNRVPVGAGDDYEAGETGGAATVTLTAAQSGLPNHGHAYRTQGGASSNPSNSGGLMMDNAGSETNRSAYSGTPGDSAANQIGGSGSANASEAHENMPPFLAVYWQIKY